MNAKLSIVSVALALLAGTAGAADLVNLPAERGTLTRAEVQAELLRARAAGELVASGDSYGLQWAQLNTAKRPSFAVRASDESRSAARPVKSHDDIGG